MSLRDGTAHQGGALDMFQNRLKEIALGFVERIALHDASGKVHHRFRGLSTLQGLIATIEPACALQCGVVWVWCECGCGCGVSVSFNHTHPALDTVWKPQLLFSILLSIHAVTGFLASIPHSYCQIMYV